jgi:hypothetical protein
MFGWVRVDITSLRAAMGDATASWVSNGFPGSLSLRADKFSEAAILSHRR